MRWFAKAGMRIRMLFTRKQSGTQLDAELQDHLDRQIAENVAAGMSAEEARCTALRAFGNPTVVREQARATWSWNRLELLVQDVRYAVRSFARNPGFAATIVGTMALGIGAAAAMFTVVDHMLIRPVPFRDAGNLVVIQETDGSSFRWPIPWRDIEQWQAQARSLNTIAFYDGMKGRNYLEGTDSAQQVDAERISSNLFDLLGVEPALGRGFIAQTPRFAADQNAGTIVLSDAIWREVFGADRGIVGKTVQINKTSYVVSGVMPRGFRFPAERVTSPQVWVPIELESADRDLGFDAMQYSTIARLHPGTTAKNADAELKTLQSHLAARYTDDKLRNDHKVARVVPYSNFLVSDDVRRALLALLGASGVLWLIASLNVTNLLLARNMTRQREVAVRIALGATRKRVAQQMLVEGVLLNGMAALLGVGLAFASVGLLARELRQTLPLPAPATPDGWILFILLALTAFSTLVSTTWPAVLAARSPVEPGLKQGGMQGGTSKRQHRVRGALVAVEIALSLTLLVTCGLLLRTIYTLRHVPLGYRTDHIIVANLSIPSFRFEGRNLTDALYLPLLDQAQHLHGVDSAALLSEVPLGKTFVVHLELQLNGSKIISFMKAVSPDLQKVFGFHMAAGRFFSPDDTATSQPVVIVNQAFARAFSPNQNDPKAILGEKLLSLRKDVPMHVIGVLDDERQSAVSDSAVPEVEIAIPQITPQSGFYQPIAGIAMDLAVRTNRPTAEVIPEIRAILKQASPELENATITTMDQVVEDSYGSQRLAAHLLEIFGGTAFVLCIAGLYGLLAYIVSQRTRELGVRIALGASRSNLLLLVMRQAGLMLITGVVAGVGLALAAGKLVSRFLYGVSGHDVLTLVLAPALLVAVGLIAAYLPARRAAHVDPMEALRAE